MTLILVFALAIPGLAAGLSVKTSDSYSTGEPVLMMITSDKAIDPANIEINITKPNGTVIQSTPRKRGWNSDNECFETYTIDMSGTFQISVKDKSSGETANTQFVASVFSSSSLVFMIISVAVFVISLLGWLVTRNRKTARN
jgi:hypothetical protein